MLAESSAMDLKEDLILQIFIVRYNNGSGIRYIGAIEQETIIYEISM